MFSVIYLPCLFPLSFSWNMPHQFLPSWRIFHVRIFCCFLCSVCFPLGFMKHILHLFSFLLFSPRLQMFLFFHFASFFFSYSNSEIAVQKLPLLKYLVNESNFFCELIHYTGGAIRGTCIGWARTMGHTSWVLESTKSEWNLPHTSQSKDVQVASDTVI